MCGKLRYIEVVNDDDEDVMTKVPHNVLQMMPLKDRMK